MGVLGVYLIYFAILIIVPLWAQKKVKSTYKKYSKIGYSSQMTGAEVAREILNNNGLFNVTIKETEGMLSDHYDPSKKVVNLSTDNYHGRSMAAAAISAHEVGHAIQDAESYAFLRFRHTLVPVANIGSNMSFPLIIGGVLLDMANLILFGVIFMAAAVLFQFVTLPVEFNASNRAMDQLISSGVITNNEESSTKKVLNAAALTYVAAAVVALMELVRFLLMYFMSSE